MNKRIRPILALSLIMATGLSAYAQSDSIHWINNYNEAIHEAKATGKPILLTFRCVP